MSYSVIIHLSGGSVPVYALRLRESLAELGISDLSIVPYQTGATSPDRTPRNWHSPSTREVEWTTNSYDQKMSSGEAIHLFLGHSEKQDQIMQGHTLHCSLMNGATNTFFPEVVRALLKDDGFICVRVSQSKHTSGPTSALTGYFKVIPHSYAQSIELALEGALKLIIQSVRQLISGNSTEDSDFTPLTVKKQNIQITPAELNRCIRKIRTARLRKRLQQALTLDRWNIGVINAPIEEVALSINAKWNVQWLNEPCGTEFQADPFGLEGTNDKRIMFEYMKNGRGSIHAFSEGRNEILLEDTNGHFSYPYTFYKDGHSYVIPESSNENSLRIYPIDPASLEYKQPIEIQLGIHAVDPSIIHYNNHWWLFCTDRSSKGADTRLHLFHADMLAGPWKPHPLNPLKTDIRSARPAGHLFVHQGILYRPSQDSSITYGGRIIINRVDELDTKRFNETQINSIGPENISGPYSLGTHTISAFGNQTCIDGKRRVFYPLAFKRFFT
jgi:hypothetical protein